MEKINDKGQTSSLKSGDYFGVEVLTEKLPYAATAVALHTTCCWKLDKATLKQSVPSLSRSKRSSNSVA